MRWRAPCQVHRIQTADAITWITACGSSSGSKPRTAVCAGEVPGRDDVGRGTWISAVGGHSHRKHASCGSPGMPARGGMRAGGHGTTLERYTQAGLMLAHDFAVSRLNDAQFNRGLRKRHICAHPVGAGPVFRFQRAEQQRCEQCLVQTHTHEQLSGVQVWGGTQGRNRAQTLAHVSQGPTTAAACLRPTLPPDRRRIPRSPRSHEFAPRTSWSEFVYRLGLRDLGITGPLRSRGAFTLLGPA